MCPITDLNPQKDEFDQLVFSEYVTREHSAGGKKGKLCKNNSLMLPEKQTFKYDLYQLLWLIS